MSIFFWDCKIIKKTRHRMITSKNSKLSSKIFVPTFINPFKIALNKASEINESTQYKLNSNENY